METSHFHSFYTNYLNLESLLINYNLKYFKTVFNKLLIIPSITFLIQNKNLN